MRVRESWDLPSQLLRNPGQLVFEATHIIEYSRSALDSSGCRYTGSLCVTALGAVCTSVAIADFVLG